MHPIKRGATGWPWQPMQVKPAWMRKRAKSERQTGRGLQRNNTGNNYLAIVHLCQLTLNLLIETFPGPLPFSVYSGRLPVSGTLLQIPTRMNEKDWNLTNRNHASAGPAATGKR